MKKIVLPPTEGGYYRFGELPQIIAEALHPDELYPDDYILSVVIWRDDGTELGQYIECTPPAGSRERDTSRHAEWTQRPIELTDEEKTHPDRCKWVNWRWHEQRRPEEERAYWPESGELIVWGDDTQNELDQIVSIASERDWYQKRMSEAARRGQDDPRRLCVVDGNLNSLTYTHGAALDRGWVHIDKLNQWGANLDTVNVFSIGEVQREAPAERQGGQNEARKTEPLQRSRAQEAAILEAIAGEGCDPKNLPANESGKPGVKAAIRGRVEKTHPDLFIRGSRVFNKAWERLRALGEIENKDGAA